MSIRQCGQQGYLLLTHSGQIKVTYAETKDIIRFCFAIGAYLIDVFAAGSIAFKTLGER